jgi:hypothetical protein
MIDFKAVFRFGHCEGDKLRTRLVLSAESLSEMADKVEPEELVARPAVINPVGT